jgi:hypothetical protein
VFRDDGDGGGHDVVWRSFGRNFKVCVTICGEQTTKSTTKIQKTEEKKDTFKGRNLAQKESH